MQEDAMSRAFNKVQSIRLCAYREGEGVIEWGARETFDDRFIKYGRPRAEMRTREREGEKFVLLK